jgi:hypothetical protein
LSILCNFSYFLDLAVPYGIMTFTLRTAPPLQAPFTHGEVLSWIFQSC